jgi:hypothetical protein
MGISLGAYLLTQLCTGHNWFSTYAKTFGFRNDDQCVCGAQEIVTHVLVDCPNVREVRRKLRSEAGDAFNSVSLARTARALLDFAEASQKFKSRAP